MRIGPWSKRRGNAMNLPEVLFESSRANPIFRPYCEVPALRSAGLADYGRFIQMFGIDEFGKWWECIKCGDGYDDGLFVHVGIVTET
jgi:hypothetical protein